MTDEVQVYGAPPASELGYLLHGTLEVGIFQAVNLPNLDMFSERIRQCTFKLKEVTGLNSPITSDPYTTVVLAGARVARTRVISNNVNPVWKEHFLIPVAHYVRDIVFEVKDQDVVGSQFIGKVSVSAGLVLNGGVLDGWFDLLNQQGKPGAKLQLSARYIPVEHNPLYTEGSSAHGVPNTYFPSRKGCRLTLYQDAHIYDNTLPSIPLESGKSGFVQARCWEELCSAINDAKHLVYIAGWSVFDKITLVRDTTRPVVEGGTLTLGELLKKKANQGVRVLMLVWDDKTSHDMLLVKTVCKATLP
jgi:phospholipase D1/2